MIASIIEELSMILRKSYSYDVTFSRADEANLYCQRYRLTLGTNIWHNILDGAIRLRKELSSCNRHEEIK